MHAHGWVRLNIFQTLLQFCLHVHFQCTLIHEAPGVLTRLDSSFFPHVCNNIFTNRSKSTQSPGWVNQAAYFDGTGFAEINFTAEKLNQRFDLEIKLLSYKGIFFLLHNEVKTQLWMVSQHSHCPIPFCILISFVCFSASNSISILLFRSVRRWR